jgi:osmotically-inducible protein OsmY
LAIKPNSKEEPSMSNEELAAEVADQIRWDKRVDDAGIAVSVVDGGVVVLRGTVSSLHQKHEATRAAESVAGVRHVNNVLDVRILDERRRGDADLRGDILRALALDESLPLTIDADVSNGRVLLKGLATWQWQREEAERIALSVPGVVSLGNAVEVETPPTSTVPVETAIRSALEQSAAVEADKLVVRRDGDVVTLAGVVRSDHERNEALGAAWATPGVSEVVDLIAVEQ